MVIFGLACGTAAVSEPVDSKTAKSMLFAERGRMVEPGEADFLTPEVVDALSKQLREFDYYAAVAVSPGEPVASGLQVLMANFHTPESAEAAALEECNAQRTSGKACIIVARVLPKKYESSDLTLSVEATRALRKEFRKLKPPRAFAISETTGHYAMDRGDGGRAIAACNSQASEKGVTDCKLVVFDE